MNYMMDFIPHLTVLCGESNSSPFHKGICRSKEQNSLSQSTVLADTDLQSCFTAQCKHSAFPLWSTVQTNSDHLARLTLEVS